VIGGSGIAAFLKGQRIMVLAASEANGKTFDEPSIAHLQCSNPKEWARQFRAWADGHDPALPVLSDAAMSRESIYPDLT
jgi:hypothetical protein